MSKVITIKVENTCGQCAEFDAKRNVCNCPLNAFPSYSDGEYVYSKTEQDSKACSLFSPVEK